MDYYDAQIKALRQLRYDINRAIAFRKTSLGRKRNAQTPVNRLPIEVLAMIFAQSVEIGPRRTEHILSLSTVCWLWMQAVNASPSLFKVVSMDDPLWDICLRKSGSSSLHVLEYSLHKTSAGVLNARFVNALLPQKHRLRTLECSETQLCLWASILEPLPAALLHLDAEAPFGSEMQLRVTTGIQRLLVYGFAVIWPSATEQALPYALTKLHLDAVTVSTSDDLAAVISNSPSLEILILTQINATAEGQNTTAPVILERLTTVEANDVPMKAMVYLLESVQAPMVRSTLIQRYERQVDERFVEGIANSSSYGLVRSALGWGRMQYVQISFGPKWTFMDGYSDTQRNSTMHLSYTSGEGHTSTRTKADLTVLKRFFEALDTLPVHLILTELPDAAIPNPEFLQSFRTLEKLKLRGCPSAPSLCHVLARRCTETGLWPCPRLKELQVCLRERALEEVRLPLKRLIEARANAGPSACSAIQVSVIDQQQHAVDLGFETP